MSISTAAVAAEPTASVRLYRAVWRWHFYAGLVVVPFLAIMALSAIVMLYGNTVETAFGERHYVSQGGDRASLVEQSEAAVAAVPNGSLKLAVVPKNFWQASTFVVDADGKNVVIAIDPHGPKIIGTVVQDDTWYYWAKNVHGTLLIGTIGDRIIEIVAGLGIVLVITGLYMWWPRNGRDLQRALTPNLLQRGRGLWKELHVSLGFYLAIFLVFFLISGLTWSGIWGERIVQAWSTFPAAKWDNVPLSDKTHAAMNHGAMEEVPWALEQTPMPESGSHAGHRGVVAADAPVDLDSVVAFARANGFDEQFRINAPRDDGGVFTVSADSMDGDTSNAMGDRTVHIDRYTGNVLADVRFADYSLAGKAMAVGIALHQGNLGPLNTLANFAVCGIILFLCASGGVMWWKRRPAKGLGAPRYPKDYRASAAALVIAIAVCIIFPLTGIAVAIFALVDFFLPKRFKEVQRREAEA